MAAKVAILKIFKHVCPRIRREALGWQWDLELLDSFRSNIQVGRHGGQLENLETTSAVER